MLKGIRNGVPDTGSWREDGPLTSCQQERKIMRTAKIVVIEGNRILRDGIVAIINEQPDFLVVKALRSDHDMLRHVRRLKPDVVLLDMGLRRTNALRAVASLGRHVPRVRVIGMGLLPSHDDVVGYVQAGAAGFVLKNATLDDVLRTLRTVVGGEIASPPSLARSLLDYVADQAFRSTGAIRPLTGRMTQREREITLRVARGENDMEIARQLRISSSAVRSHISNILEKIALRGYMPSGEVRRSPRRS